MTLASGRKGMAASPHPLATEAGLSVLKAGGNAIEAAIAIGATIGVVCPHFCGLGGDAVWLVADRNGRRDCFLGIGQAATILPDFDANIPVRGPMSMLDLRVRCGCVAARPRIFDPALARRKRRCPRC